MKKLLLSGIIACSFIGAKAQLAGTYSVPATYSTIGAAINDLNTQGVSGPVTILIDAGYTETLTAGGYTLTATGTATSPIVFQKNGGGTNPLITSYAGSNTPSSTVQDGIWSLVGSDYITIDGIDLLDPNNTNPATMEYGYGLFKASADNGCQNNVIRNCAITLSRENNDFGSGPASDGSRGIDVVNATIDAHTSALTITITAGANSNNLFENNTIENCNIGIAIIGFGDTTPFSNADQNNVIGGSLSTGNSIINYGGASSASAPADGVRTLAQYSLDVSYNTINNNNGSGINHTNTIRGIFVNTAQSANTGINNNTITLHGGGTFYSIYPIQNAAGSTAASNTVNINNNLIANSTYTSASSGGWFGIYNSGAPQVLSISNNTLLNNSTNATSGSYYNIYNAGAVTGTINLNNNLINLGTFSASATSALLAGIYNGSGLTTTTLSASGNTLQNVVHAGTGSSSFYGIYNASTTGLTIFDQNMFNNISLNMSGTVYMMRNPSYRSIITDNMIAGGFNKTLSGGSFFGYYGLGGSTGTATVSGNNFSNINLTASTLYGIYHFASSSQTLSVLNNTISNVTNGSTSTMYGMYLAYMNAISNNLITNLNNNGAVYGIYRTSASATTSIMQNTISSLTSNNSSVYGLYGTSTTTTNLVANRIYDLTTNYTFGNAYGLYISSGTLWNIHNNLIGDIKAPNSSGTFPVNGIYISSGTRYNIYYNTVYLNATSTGATFGSNAIYTSTTPNVTLRNNIFVNLSTPNGGQYATAYRRSSTSIANYSTTSNNNIFYAGTPGVNNLIFYDGFNSYQTLGAFQTAVSPRESASQTENSPFLSVLGTSSVFLHINPAAPSLAESGAVNIPGITNDYDTDIRQGNPGYTGSGTAPDIGADEFEANVTNCNAVVGGTAFPTNILGCTGTVVTLNALGYSAGTGITYNWQVGTTPGGPYTNVVGGNGETYPLAYTTPTLAPGVYYYVLEVSCSISSLSAVSSEATVSISGYPTLTVTPASATLCVPGASPVTLSASGADTYTWGPSAGLTNTTGATTNAFPGTTTTYTINGTNLAGCSSSITAVVNVAETPNILELSVTPTVVCDGGSATLQAMAATTSSYSGSSITYSPIPEPVGSTTLCSGGTQITPLSIGSLDDGAWYNIPIPFEFKFFGVTYTSCAISTNGFLSPGTGAPYTYNGYGSTFPSSFAGRPCIGPIYGDLQWSYQGTVTTFTTGTAPNRMFVVNWTGGEYWTGGGTGTVTSQAVIYETSNIIEAHLTQNTGNANASEVIQNAIGNMAFPAPGRNNQVWTVPVPDAYRWTPAGPVSYSWTPNTFLDNDNISMPVASSVTSSINYSVEVLSTEGCTASGTLALTWEPNPTVTVAGSNSICSGSTVTLTASGAVNYSWSTGDSTAVIADTPSTTITYSVVGTSSLGCADSTTHMVTVYITPTLSIAGTSTFCAGGSIMLNVSGADTYTWNNGSNLTVIAPFPPGTTTYSVTGTNTLGMCTGDAVKTVTSVALPQVTITASPNATVCPGAPVQLIASGTGVDTYSWNTGPTGPFNTVSPTVTTNYIVYVGSDFTGCKNSSSITIVASAAACVGLEEHTSGLIGLSVYPNPNNGVFTIELNNGQSKTYEISDLTGRIVLKGSSDSGKAEVNMGDLAKGVYYIRIQSNNAFEVFKIIKQ